MVAQSVNTLIAHKAINLATELSNSEKRVAGAIIDHFNRRTGQCDPSLDCIAELIGMSRRTVIRAADRLQKLGFIRRIRHGGKFHRNSYEPVWSRFHQVEAEWNARRGARRTRLAAPKVSPCLGQSRHLGSDMADPQTFPTNLLKETYDQASLPQKSHAPSPSNDKKGSAREVNPKDYFPGHQYTSRSLRTAQSGTASRDAAERRWNDELLNQYRGESPLYSRIVEAIDVKLMSATTEAELRHRGSGVTYLMNELFARDATLARLRAGNSASISKDGSV
jgi:predicted transcriptional regulator